MSVNLDAIRAKIAELNGQRKNSNIQLWKPGVGKYRVRLVPWKNPTEGSVFCEKQFYYIGNNRGIVAPQQFGKPDPIGELRQKLYSSGKPDDRILAKKLQPKMRAYAAVIVRGEESKGVQVWSFGKQIYQKLLNYWLLEDPIDLLDPNEGFDVMISIMQSPGKQFQDFDVEAARKPSKLSNDEEQQKTWLDAVPNMDDMYPLKTYDEVEAILNSWLNDGAQDAAPYGSSDGTPRGGGNSVDQLDKLVGEVKGEVEAPKAPPTKAATSKPTPKKPNLENDGKKIDLDAAFDELMNE